MEETKTPAEWETYFGIKIMDPDGWDRKNFTADWATPLTESEFNAKMMRSTIMSGPKRMLR